jgi:hypothetical protein
VEIVLVLVVVLDLAALDYDYENDALRVCRRLTESAVYWRTEVSALQEDPRRTSHYKDR